MLKSKNINQFGNFLVVFPFIRISEELKSVKLNDTAAEAVTLTYLCWLNCSE